MTVTQRPQNTIEVRIGNIDVYYEVNSGASANIMDKYQFRTL